MDNAGKRGGGEERQRVRKKLEKKRVIPPTNKLAFCNQTFVQRPLPLFRSTEDDDDDDVDDGDPVSSPFARMVRKIFHISKMS